MSDSKITQWITFAVADEDDPLSMGNDSDMGNAWKDIMFPLPNALYNRGVVWGRLLEDSSRMLIVAIWKDKEAIERFEASDDGRKFWQDLTMRSNGTATSMVAEFPSPVSDLTLRGYTEIVWVSFPPGVYESRQREADALTGLNNRVSGNVRRRDLYRRHPCRGRVIQPKDHVRIVFYQSWVDEPTERRFKEETDRLFSGTRLENWHEKMRTAGAEKWEHMHFEFTSVI